MPSLECTSLVSTNGIMELSWRFEHTGGLPLTSLSVSYTVTDDSGSPAATPSPVPVDSLNAMSVTVQNLEAGLEYTFTITAENGNGISSIQCGPTSLETGKATCMSEC